LIYIPTFLSPKNSTINPTVINTFTCQINGNSCNKYRLRIYKNSDNTLIYDTTEITITALYDKDTLSVNIPANTMTANNEYKWTIQVFEGTLSATSGETLVKAYGSATVTLTVPATITAKTYNFTSTFTHPQSIGIKKFKYILMDSNNTIITDTGYQFSGKLKFTYSGFLNNTSYKIECKVVDQNDIEVSSGVKTFSVAYSQPSLNVKPTTVLLKDKSAIKVMWQTGVQINGVVSGSGTFINDFMTGGNHGYKINASSSLSYDIDIPEEFLCTATCVLSSNYNGVICSLDNDYTIGYEDGRFYFNNSGIKAYGMPRTIPESPFIIAIKPTYIIIKTSTYMDIIKT
jgi:hypothetical protein